MGSTINLLVVTARPRGTQDVGYRTISRPLVGSLRQDKLPVKIDILRPGTYKALENHLRIMTEQNGVGYYHVIHFDVHGAVQTYPSIQYLLHNRYGRDKLQPYEGTKAFLFLEGDKDNSADPLEATELAQLLITHQIPIAILNACQSGKQTQGSESSLASRLMQSGVQMVLAMGYSVTVTAAELLMKTLYQQLFNGCELATAICAARSELYNRKGRRAHYNQEVYLEDWLLPVVYQNQPQQLKPQPFTSEEIALFWKKEAGHYTPVQPIYGFVGRDLDILQIEKQLLIRRNMLLIRGMGGTGKTTLMQHLAEWWQRTSFVEQVFYFGYDEKAYTRQQVMDTIAQRLMSKAEYATFQPLPFDMQQAKLVQLLRSRRHLLILDNLESITGTNLAILHTLSAAEQRAMQSLLTALVDGQTLVLLGSRAEETWLSPGTFAENVYELAGLDPEAASVLADRILQRHEATQYRKDENLPKLLKLLAGFPLALEVVLTNLAHQSPAQVLAALQVGDVQIDPKSDTQEKTESILQCIDYSHSNLSPEAQALLSCLAPFTAVFWLDTLENYTRHLKQQPILASLPFEQWTEVLQEAQHWGLLSPDPRLPRFLRLQPIFPYFLRSRFNDAKQKVIQQAIETAFQVHYDKVGYAFFNLLESNASQEQQKGLMLVHMEYENLVTGLNFALAAQVSILDPYRAISAYLDAIQDQHRGLELGQTVLHYLENYPAEKLAGSLGAEFVGVIDNVAQRYMRLKEYSQAEALFKKALDLHLKISIFDDKTSKMQSAGIYLNLGVVALEQRQWLQAERHHQHALRIYVEFDDLPSQARTYYNLGIIAQEQQRWKPAEQYYQRALQIYTESNDYRLQAQTSHQLANVALEQRQWKQAEQHCYRALRIYKDYNDSYGQAQTYHQLGTVALEQRQWTQAEQYYQHALQIHVESNNRYEQAGTYGQLGVLAREQKKWTQAGQYYLQALQISIESDDRHSQAMAYHQLGMVALEQRQWLQARNFLIQALEIFVSYRDAYNIGFTIYGFARLWQVSRDRTIPAHIASILEVTIEEVEAKLSTMVDDKPGVEEHGEE